MILTTSRKPGKRTRRLAKILARFFNWYYVQRGKTSIKEFDANFAIIQEVKGNPGILKIYNSGEVAFSLKFTLGETNKVKVGRETPVFFGKLPFNVYCLSYFNALSANEKFSRKVAISISSPKSVFVRRRDEKLIFELKYNNKLVARLISRERWIQCKIGSR
jgi:U3 small nucleolar ribonucleoprotein protein IMP4